MAFYNVHQHLEGVVAKDATLADKQFYAVKLDSSDGTVILAVAGDGIGILQNKPSAAGHAASVAVSGRSKAVAGGAINPGQKVTSDANGKLVAATVAGTNALGMYVGDAACVADQIITVSLDVQQV